MDILCIIPPYIPSYFNAGHHLAVFQVAAYLRTKMPNLKIIAKDGAALNLTWKEICDLLIQNPRLIVLMNDFDGIDTFHRFLTYAKKLSPRSKIITFGRLSNQIPQFFLQYSLDAIHFSGDPEEGVFNYLQYLLDTPVDPAGVLLKEFPDRKVPMGVYLDSDKWILPDIMEIPYQAYNFMYANDLNKFCGIPERQELIVPVARGCPINCFFCDVPKMQGKYERRLSIANVIQYIENSFSLLPFEYVSFYSPTFTLNKRWVQQLCEKFLNIHRSYPWKCTTALSCLDANLIKHMSKAGCIRISLGIETITGAAKHLPKSKQNIQNKFFETIDITRKVGIELNAFIILGLPSDDPDDVEQTIRFCLQNGVRVRPTIYTPFHELQNDMHPQLVSTYNRQSFIDNILPEDVMNKYYKLFYQNVLDTPTEVMHKIAKYKTISS